MKVYLDCIPCFMRQALAAARQATEDKKQQREVLDKVASLIPTLPLDATPIDMGRKIHRVVKEVTRTLDPYREVKRQCNDHALKLSSQFRKRVDASCDPLLAALKLAAASNVIDFAVTSDFDLNRSIEESLTNDLDLVDYPVLKERLESVEEVLYIGDNAGEIVFDRIVVEQLNRLGKKVTFVVRREPIINDVTIEDASYVGMDKIAKVITSGSDAPGTSLRYCTEEFIHTFNRSKLILAKGQGNFEGLSNEDAPLFFLLKVKCPVVARELDTTLGKIVLRAGK